MSDVDTYTAAITELHTRITSGEKPAAVLADMYEITETAVPRDRAAVGLWRAYGVWLRDGTGMSEHTAERLAAVRRVIVRHNLTGQELRILGVAPELVSDALAGTALAASATPEARA